MANSSKCEFMRIGREWRRIPYPCRIKKCSDGRFRIEEIVENQSPVDCIGKSALEFRESTDCGRDSCPEHGG